MARKSINELIAQATADFPDNTGGLVTPAKLRNWAIDFLNSIAPAYGVLQITPGTLNQTLNIAPQLLVFNSAYNSDPAQTTAAVPASTVQRAEKGNSTINFVIDFECQTGRFVTFTLYKNGVATPWRVTGNGGGNGNPVAVALTAVDYADPAATYAIYASCEVNGTAVTLSNAALVVQVEPVKSFT